MVARPRLRSRGSVALNYSVDIIRWGGDGRVLGRGVAQGGRGRALPRTQCTPGAIRGESDVSPSITE
eukprot:5989485-Pleurochrysis_carterae.AAC.1